MMRNSVLFCATVDFHFKAFHLPYMKWFKEQGWEVHLAASGDMELPYVDKKYNLSIQRSPFRVKNIQAYYELKKIMNEQNYKIIHCHTPVGGVLARLAARTARKNGTKVLYTAHGFHFCKGAPIINWLAYYPLEKMLAYYTDCLITINEEDFALAQQKLKAKKIEHVHGVGVNQHKFKPVSEVEKNKMKKSFGYKPDDFLLFYAAEFNRNKNQQVLIHALALLKEEIPNIKLLLAGKGTLQKQCEELAESLGVGHLVEFLGYQENLPSIMPMCDVAVASSLREGLPVNVLEAMASGLPVVASDNRGHRELVLNNRNGWVLDPANITEWSNKIKLLYLKKEIREQFGMNGRKMITSKYSIDKILHQKSTIYKHYMDGTEVKQWGVH
ncbi:glycosyltransferase family 4 protein [Bacillus spongiae]|uniref:Glycosyltransferase family 4 protein n=1 Tax=Bacillus spongiae TaxID=2683610 RepID=A0ABU8HEF3_9BACI